MTEDRTKTNKEVLDSIDASESVGFKRRKKRDGDTFVDEELGDKWNDSFDSNKVLEDALEVLDPMK